VLPPHSLSGEMLDRVREQASGLARELGVIGLLNVQFAVYKGELYVIEANPRASRTVPFVSKAIGLPLARLACRLMLGEKIGDLDLPEFPSDEYVCVKEAVLPFDRFAGADALLGPEMRSTGEVMGIARDFPTAFAKAQAAAGANLPDGGAVFISVSEGDKVLAGALASQLHDLGFRVIATRGTAEAIARMGIPAQPINKIPEGSPHVVDLIEAGEVSLVVNTPTGSGARTDGWEIRAAAIGRGIPCITTMAGGLAAARAIGAARSSAPEVIALQEMHQGLNA
jgi:carbamoyl-phosphate synthase large subunit